MILTSTSMSHTNRLAHESSPYLLQHAHNPVDWYAWGDEALDRAKRENKLLLISIGYSACHWCHVMERESFESEETAAIMNELFVCIKVDREERPDVDQVYMNAVQLISGHGGWPLNCFALPDGRPVYGGTYYRPEQWREILRSLADLHAKEPEKVLRYAEQLTKGVRQSEWVEAAPDSASFTLAELEAIYKPWQAHFDRSEGGMNRAPKFPLPNNYQFMLRYWKASGDATALDQVRLTLDKMAFGGIYDQVGGGFARYSTDSLWKVPHFEKMLYDNGQLLELYAEAYQATGDPLYAQVVRETAGFVARELTSPEGAFYSALDADSEGEEGKYYVWSKEELESILGDGFPLFRDAYNINSIGFWEEGNYIPLRKRRDAELAADHGMGEAELRSRLEAAKAMLLPIREKRIHPGLDDKTLISWNALMAKGYVAAYRALGDPAYLDAAVRNLGFLLAAGRRPDGGLFRTYKAGPGDQSDHGDRFDRRGRFSINGFLEDYAFMAEALAALYQATFQERWLSAARELIEYAIAHFRDPVSGLFYFTSDLDKPLVARKMEIMDNVTPASNSSMAKALFAVGTCFGEQSWLDMAAAMLNQVKEEMPAYASGYSNWGMLALNLAAPFHEVVITGPDAEARRREIAGHYLPNTLMAGSASPGSLPLLADRFAADRTAIYVCRDRTCKLPVATAAEALALLQAG
ncbi:MAG: protein containing a thioredoxin domain [Fibrobacteres bacterium]|nr:protein containing a thioredoxin domain [Fibrobacterota bacterium]